jgi:hypothetical protein
MGWLTKWLGRKPDGLSQPLPARATTIPADWASSPPHLALLRRFLSMRDARTGVPDHWASMFGTHPRNVVEGFVALHLLEPASLAETIAALRSSQFQTAIRIADAWRNGRFELPVHPAQEALTIKPAPRSIEERTAEVAKTFTLRPKILAHLEPEQWEGLHLNYAIWQLLGHSATEKCMPGFTGQGAMDAATVLRMMGFYDRHLQDLDQWKKLGVRKASIMCTKSGSCETCLALDKRTYRLDKLPELPYQRCTCALGCRCLYFADLGF